MTIGTAVVTRPGDSGLLVPKLRKLYADNQAELAKAFDFPDLSVEITTSTNDSGLALNLSDYFEFPSGMIIPVKLRHYARTENDRYFQELEYMIVGSEAAGTDPLIVGDGSMTTGVRGQLSKAFGVIAGAAVKYGRVHYRGVLDAEATDGTNSQGVALGAGSSGVYALTFGINGGVRVNGVHVEQETPSAAEAGYGIVLDPDPAGTANLNVVQQDDGTVATNATAGTAFDIDLEVFLPVNAFLVMNGTPDPGEVNLYVAGISSDEVKHRVDVFIGQPIDASFYGS